MIKNYRKKPVVIQAVQWTGNNWNEIQDFMSGQHPKKIGKTIRIPTLKGHIYASELDYIIKGVKDEFYPCKPDIFQSTYEPI